MCVLRVHVLHPLAWLPRATCGYLSLTDQFRSSYKFHSSLTPGTLQVLEGRPWPVATYQTTRTCNSPGSPREFCCVGVDSSQPSGHLGGPMGQRGLGHPVLRGLGHPVLRGLHISSQPTPGLSPAGQVMWKMGGLLRLFQSLAGDLGPPGHCCHRHGCPLGDVGATCSKSGLF